MSDLKQLEEQLAKVKAEYEAAKEKSEKAEQEKILAEAEECTCPPPGADEYKEVAWAVTKYGDWTMKPIWIPRPKVADGQVKIDMLYCGVCHSDCHHGMGDLGMPQYPFVGGHELLGKVVEIGKGVTRVKVGDIAAIGCMVDSCGDCDQCKAGEEQYCRTGCTWTYASKRTYANTNGNKELQTHGGYTASHVTYERFVIKVPDGMDLERAAPILCAGVTLYDPLRHWGFTKTTGKTVGVVGIGGLGTMGIKIAKALGHKVVAISTTAKKEELAKSKGADVFVASKTPESIAKAAGTCDIILNTAAANHDLTTYLPLLNNDGVLVQLGLVLQPHPLTQIPLILGRKSVAGSVIGGIKSTEEVLQLCAEKNIYPDINMITAAGITDAWKELVSGSNGAGVRFVVDIKKSLQDKDFLPKDE